MNKETHLFTSESVTEGHPDKICDQISDAILDEIIRSEIFLSDSDTHCDGEQPADLLKLRCACETLVTAGLVVVSGEIRTRAYIDVPAVVRGVLQRIGYTHPEYGFDEKGCGIVSAIRGQSPDIAKGVDNSLEVRSRVEDADSLAIIGAGDQGMVFGYACNETKDFMPMPIHLANRLSEKLAYVRRKERMPYLRPDGKAQVSVRYEHGKPMSIEGVLISAQHDESVSDSMLEKELVKNVVIPVLEEEAFPLPSESSILINPAGRFVVGGPAADTGLTGRKIIVDTYGGMGRHGGGAFSGKDFTKVDRSAAYASRWVAKNIVASGLADRCEIQVAYAIGVATPVSLMIDTFGTAKIPENEITLKVKENFDLRPAGIISSLDLVRPIYEKTAAYGHFGRNLPEFSWEKTNKVNCLI